MSASIANATIRIGATAEDVANAVSSAIAHFQRLGTGVQQQTSHTLSHLRRFAAEAAAVFGGIHLGHFISDAVQKFERAEIAFEVMLKSASKAKQLIKDIQAFEFNTPLKFTEITSAMQRLLTAQFALEDVPTMLRIIGDAAAASGDSIAFAVERVTRSLGQMKARGYITGEEIRELAHANIAARRYLVEGMSREMNKQITADEVTRMIEDKKVDAGFALRAILSGMDRDFGGLQKRLGTETFEGQFRRIGSQLELISIGAIKSLDRAFGIKKYLSEWVDFFSEARKNADGFGEALLNNQGFQIISKLATTLGTVVSTTFNIATTAVKSFFSSLLPTGTYLRNMGVDTEKLANIVINAFHIMTLAVEFFANVINHLLVPIRLAIAGFWALGNFGATMIAKLTGDKQGQMNAEENRLSGKEFLENTLKHLDPGEFKKRLDGVDEVFAGFRKRNRMEHMFDPEKMSKSQTAIVSVAKAVANHVSHWDLGSMAIGKFYKQVSELKSLASTVDFGELMKHLKEESEGFLRDARTPLQALQDELKGLENAFAFDELSPEAFEAGAGNALRRAAGAFKPAEVNVAGMMASGSEEAQRLIIEASRQGMAVQVPDLLRQLIRESEQQTKQTRDLLEQARSGGLIMVPGGG